MSLRADGLERNPEGNLVYIGCKFGDMQKDLQKSPVYTPIDVGRNGTRRSHRMLDVNLVCKLRHEIHTFCSSSLLVAKQVCPSTIT